MSEDRVAPNLDHWLGPHLGLLGKARTQPTSEDHGLHESYSITGANGTRSGSVAARGLASTAKRRIHPDQRVDPAVQIEVDLSQGPAAFGRPGIGQQ